MRPGGPGGIPPGGGKGIPPGGEPACPGGNPGKGIPPGPPCMCGGGGKGIFGGIPGPGGPPAMFGGGKGIGGILGPAVAVSESTHGQVGSLLTSSSATLHELRRRHTRHTGHWNSRHSAHTCKLLVRAYPDMEYRRTWRREAWRRESGRSTTITHCRGQGRMERVRLSFQVVCVRYRVDDKLCLFTGDFWELC